MSLPRKRPFNIDECSVRNQIIAAIAVNLGTFSFAVATGWLSPVLDEITSDNSPYGAPLNSTEVALTGGLLYLGGFVGLPIFTVFTSKYGRKAASYFIGAPIAIGLLFILCANSVTVMLLGRFLCGFGAAGALSLPTLLVGECCTPRVRGLLASILVVIYALGLIVAFILGAYLPFRLFTGILMAVPIIYMILFWFIPETPVFLLKVGKEQEAAKAISWFRRQPAESGAIRAELVRISRQLRGAEPINIEFEPTKEELASELEWIYMRQPENQQKMLSQYSGVLPYNRPPSWKLLFTCPMARKGLMLCLFIIVSQAMMGMCALDSYSNVVFEKAETGLSADAFSVIYAVIFLVGSSIGSLLIDYIGRRPLQIYSSLIVCVGQAILGWCFQDPSLPKWVPFVGLLTSVLSFNTGPGFIGFVICSEVFANEVRDAATSVIMGSTWLVLYILLQIFPLAVEAFELHNVFYFSSFMAFFTAVISWCVLLETKGFSQEEILRKLAGLKPMKGTFPNNESIMEVPLK